MKLILRRSIIKIIVAVILGLTTTVSVLAAVELLYFRAEPGDQKVFLQWDSGSETDTLGYLIYRKTENGIYSIITPTIDGPIILLRTDSTIPYMVTDTNVTNGVKYWYKLTGIEKSNPNPVLLQEVTVIPGVSTPTPTPTPTPTSTSTSAVAQNPTPTSTRTPTKTVNSAIKTSKPTKTKIVPSSTATRSNTIIGQPTSPPLNPAPTGTLTPEGDSQPVDDAQSQSPEIDTPTLEPLPSLALVFADTPAYGEQPTLTPAAPTHPAKQNSSWISKKGLTIVGLLGVIWLGLGGWFFFSFKRME
jgi:hypothetical protein